MSNRPTFFLIVSVKAGKKGVRFFFMLPMWLILDFLDVLDDICELTALFCKNVTYRTLDGSKQTLSDSLRMTSGLMNGILWELAFETGPLDMVDIDVTEKNDIVKVKVLTR